MRLLPRKGYYVRRIDFEGEFKMDEDRKKQIQNLLNHPIFNIGEVDEKQLCIYDQSLTHSSYAKEMRDKCKGVECPDNERLEFLGNFVLGLAVSEHLFEKPANYSEGEMTKKMGVVSNEMLAEVIRKNKIGIEGCIQLGNQVSITDDILADAFEAFIGAVYLDRGKGMPKAKEILLALLSDETEHFDSRNYIGMLQEFVQKKYGTPEYYVEEETMLENHRHVFKAVVKISGKKRGEGTGDSKQSARMEAARDALNKLEKI